MIVLSNRGARRFSGALRRSVGWIGICAACLCSAEAFALTGVGRMVTGLQSVVAVVEVAILVAGISWYRGIRRTLTLKKIEHLRIFVEQAPVAIAMFDKSMRYVAASDRWSESHHTLSPESLIGRSHYDVFPELPQRWKDVHRRCLQGATEKCDEELFVRADGSRQWVRWGVRPWRVVGAVGGILIFSEDITDRKIAEGEASQAAARVEVERALRGEADRLCRAKDEFIATVSHELRTPLQAMIGWIQIAKRVQADPDRLAHALAVLRRSAETQSQLVADIFDIQKIIRGNLPLELETISLRAILSDAVDLLMPEVQDRSIELVAPSFSTEIMVVGDRRRLVQCFCNILSNALKFSPRSSRIEMSVSTEGSTAHVAVRDYGCGIEREFLPRVFNRFEQEGGRSERGTHGLGLGLAIVKSLVEAHGGSVRADSEGRGKGTVFTIALPLVTPAGAE